MSLETNYRQIINDLSSATHLLVVSKTRSPKEIEELYNLGQRHFGENRIQELLDKDKNLEHLKDLKWHMIGHVQTNKLKKILDIERLCAIHSMDRPSLSRELCLLDLKIQRKNPIGLFWEFNLSKDEAKQGFSSLGEAMPFIESCSNLVHFFNQGLMCMGPLEDDHSYSKTRKTFAELKSFKDILKKDKSSSFFRTVELSMGMSNDYKIAIEEGSQWVRIGSKIFL